MMRGVRTKDTQAARKAGQPVARRQSDFHVMPPAEITTSPALSDSTMQLPDEAIIEKTCRDGVERIRVAVLRQESLQDAVRSFVADCHRIGMCPSEVIDYFCVSTPSMLHLAGCSEEQSIEATHCLDEAIADYEWA
jgi:hypothetical protein